MNGQLEQIRLRINETDKELSCLFSQRMDLVAQVAKIKEKAGLPVYDPKREKQVLDRIAQSVTTEKATYLRQVYQCLMDVSKDYERTCLRKQKLIFQLTPKSPAKGFPVPFPEKRPAVCFREENRFLFIAGRMLLKRSLKAIVILRCFP